MVAGQRERERETGTGGTQLLSDHQPVRRPETNLRLGSPHTRELSLKSAVRQRNSKILQIPLNTVLFCALLCRAVPIAGVTLRYIYDESEIQPRLAGQKSEQWRPKL